MATGYDGGILAIEPVMIDRPHPHRSAPALPRRDRQARIGHEMRRAADVNPGKRAAIECVCDFRQSAVQGQTMRDLDSGLRLVAVSPARALELERAVVGNIDLLVRAIDVEQVGGGRETAEAIRRSQL